MPATTCTPLIALVLQAIVLVAANGLLARMSDGVSELIGVLGQPDKPSLSAVLPTAMSLVRAVGILLGLSAATWVLAAVVAGVWIRRSTRRSTPLRSLSGRARVTVGAASIATTAVAVVLTVSVTALFQPVVLTEVRGTTITVVVPGPSVIAVALLTVSVVLVTAVALLPVALSVESRGVVPELRAPSTPPRMPSALPWMVAGLSALFATIALLARPVSDDYRVMALARDHDFVSYLSEHLTTETGRYSQGTFNWVIVRIFGEAANPATALLIFVAVAASASLAVRVFLPAAGACAPHASWWFGTAFAVVAVFLAPSVTDSWLWFTSADVYMPGVACAVASAALVRLAWTSSRTGRRRALAWAGIAVLIVIGQGFSEAVSALVWVGAASLAIFAIATRKRVWLAALVFTSATIGLAAIALAPAQSARSGRIDSGNAMIGALGGAYSGLPVWNSVGWEGWLAIVALAAALAWVVRANASGRALLVQAGVGGALMVLGPPVGGAIAFLGLNWVPWRTLTVPGVAFAWGAVLVLSAVFVPLLRGERVARRQTVARVALSLGLVAALVATVLPAAALLQAGALRATMMAARDAAVLDQVSRGESTVLVNPAPPLIYPSDSRDFEFLAEQNKDWFFPGYRDWFRIPEATTLSYETRQPLGYCTSDGRVLLPGIQTCADLGAARGTSGTR